MKSKTQIIIELLTIQLRKHEAVIFVNNKEFAELIMANIPGARVEVCRIPEKQEGYEVGKSHFGEALDEAAEYFAPYIEEN